MSRYSPTTWLPRALVVSLYSANPATGFVVAYVVGELGMFLYNLIIGLPDHFSTIIESEIEDYGLDFLYKQNTRTLAIKDTELETLRRFMSYPDEKLTGSPFIFPRCAWPTEVFLSTQKIRVPVDQLREWSGLASTEEDEERMELTPRDVELTREM